jgi:hypothetical protein
MGVNLTEEGKKALYGVQTRAVEAETALAQGIAAQKKGTIVEALSYYYNAASFDPGLAEASGRLNVLSAGISGGSIGQNVRNDIERRTEWLKVLNECAAFIKTHLPYEIVYDPSLTEGKVDYQKKTVELSFDAVLVPTDGFNVLSTLLEGLDKTGKRKAWGLEEWPLYGEGSVDSPGNFSLEAALLNDRGRTIATAKAPFFKGGGMGRSGLIIYGFKEEQNITFTVKAEDISDKMTVKITRINGRDPAAAGSSGYMKISVASSPVSYPVPDKDYKIGDTGPAGGIIFYVREGAAPGEWRYLEASPRDVFTRVEWGGRGIYIGTLNRTGQGKRNTEFIVRALQKSGETGRAVQLCEGYELNGYKDWFLPSKDELNLIYQNLKRKGLGDFNYYAPGSVWAYWSSSETSDYYAWSQDFSDGSQDREPRDYTRFVRAVRAF